MKRTVLLIIFGLCCFFTGLLSGMPLGFFEEPDSAIQRIGRIDGDRLVAFLQRDRVHTLLFATGIGFVVAASLSGLYLMTAGARSTSSARPFFRAVEPGLRELPESPPYRLYVAFENIGEHDAHHMDGKIVVLDSALDAPPRYERDFRLPFEVPSGASDSWQDDHFDLPANLDRQYVAAGLRYVDPVTNRDYTQQFLWQWQGVENRVCYPTFERLNGSEAKRLQKHLRDALRHFT